MFRLPLKVKNDLEDYKRQLADHLAGKLSAERFKGIRVPWGIYSQRGGQQMMVRVRIPAGLLTAEQLRVLADTAEKFGRGLLHLTTRQDIQIHSVKVQDTGTVMDVLAGCDLSSRGGGGNTVRNIIACERSGICPREIFDVRPYALGLTEFLLAQDDSFNLPRKFKIAFNGCPHDHVGCGLNDLGLQAELRDGERGFRVLCAGGMGARTLVGSLLYSWLPAADVPLLATALKQVFAEHGDRRNKHHNRLRFLAADMGFEKFKQLLNEKMTLLRGQKEYQLRKIQFTEPPTGVDEREKHDDQEYQLFLRQNVRKQKQPGLASVSLRIPRGDLTSSQAQRLAELETVLPGIAFCTTGRQNIMLYNVSNAWLYDLYCRIKDVLSGFLYPDTLLDVVACKGALTCNLGLCNSPGLARALEQMVQETFLQSPLLKRLQIKMNGCPNACGHHPAAQIALHGMAKKVNNRLVPYYKIFIGGRKQYEQTQLAGEVGTVPAKIVPEVLKRLIQQFEKLVQTDTDIDHWLSTTGRETAAKLLRNYSAVTEINPDWYYDWDREQPFTLEGIGPGECGAGMLDMIEADLAEAKQKLNEQQWYETLKLSARALLVVKGIEPRTDAETISGFKENFVQTGIVAQRFLDLSETALNILQQQEPEAETRQYCEDLLTAVTGAYRRMDSAFRFAKVETDRKTSEQSQGPETDKAIFDLRGVKCPLNYAKTKVKLEAMGAGQILILYLDAGEPIENVPASLRNDGQEILGIEEKQDYFIVTVRKTG